MPRQAIGYFTNCCNSHGLAYFLKGLHMPEHAPWSPEDIALALSAKGWSLRRLAQDLGMSPSGVSYGLRTGSSILLRERVAAILQTSWTTLWPDRCPPQWRNRNLP